MCVCVCVFVLLCAFAALENVECHTTTHKKTRPLPPQTHTLNSGVHERLRLTVAIPFLFGVPPEAEALSEAIASGGGIIDSVQHSWGMCVLVV